MVAYMELIDNLAADALSRGNEVGEGIHLRSVMRVMSSWLEAVKKIICTSPFLVNLQNKLEDGTVSPCHYKLVNRVWFYKEKVALDPELKLCQSVLHNNHDSPGGRHSGYHRTLQRNCRSV